MDQVLDGKTPVKPVPFDVHDKVVRQAGKTHTFNEKNEPVPLYEYPKAVAHLNSEGATVVLHEGIKEHLEPVIARDADHEAELLDKLNEEKT